MRNGLAEIQQPEVHGDPLSASSPLEPMRAERAPAQRIISGAPVRVEAIEKRFGHIRAVESVSLDIGPGEFVSLLGPSGSGKTTLLMMIAGFETPSGGLIRVGDRDITHVPPNKRGVGMVFQRYALFPHMSVAKNIAFPLKMRRVAKEEIARRVENALAMVRLEGYGGRAVNQLSGGQQQRVAVARALVFEPPVLLMDEPLGALDKKLRAEMQLEIKSLHKRLGVTVLYVTHDQEEALTLSDRVAVMHEGRLVQIGSPIELYRRPASAFVADFVGKMNFLEGKIASATPAAVIVGCGDGLALTASPVASPAVQHMSVGTSVRAAVRPERLRLSRRGTGGPHSLPAASRPPFSSAPSRSSWCASQAAR